MEKTALILAIVALGIHAAKTVVWFITDAAWTRRYKTVVEILEHDQNIYRHLLHCNEQYRILFTEQQKLIGDIIKYKANKGAGLISDEYVDEIDADLNALLEKLMQQAKKGSPKSDNSQP